MKALRDDLLQRKVSLVVSLPPVDAASSADAWSTGTSKVRTLDILHRLNIETLDAFEAFARIVQEQGSGAIFLPNDYHFNANGHRMYAQWLLQQLGSRLGGAGGSS